MKRSARRPGSPARVGFRVRFWLGCLAGCGLLLATGCASVQVTVEADPDTDFSKLRTYSQKAPPRESPELPNYTAALGHRILGEIAERLDDKGFQSVPAEDAELFFAFRLSSRTRTRQRNAGDPDVDYYILEEYIEGALMIDVFDTSGKRVWHGIGRRNIYAGSDIGDIARDVVDAILDEFPPDPPVASR